MERFNLIYNIQLHVVICEEHGYCLAPCSFEQHLRRKHSARGTELKDALSALSTLQAEGPDTIRNPLQDQNPIPGLSIQTGYQCILGAACNGERQALSTCKRTVLKHQARVHSVGQKRAAPRYHSMIRTVSMQTLFPHPHTSFFLVRLAPPPDSTENPDEISRFIDEQTARSTQQWRNAFQSLPDITEPPEFTPPWLQQCGISPFLNRFKVPKEDLRASIQKTTNSSIFLEECIIYHLREYRTFLQQGRPHAINRLHACLLRSFEAGRLASKPLRPTQEVATIEKYAKYWSSLLYFVLAQWKLHANKDMGESVIIWSPPALLHADFETVKNMIEQLHVLASPYGFTFEDCFQLPNTVRKILQTEEDPIRSDSGDESDLSTSDNRSETSDLLIRIQETACNLSEAIHRISFALTRYTFHEECFESSVVSFTALHAISPAGSWIQAFRFTGFLSGMIYCMQLWLLAYCHRTQQKEIPRSENRTRRLEQLLRQECEHFLVNTSASPICELGAWRLLASKVENDGNQAPITTVSADCMQVVHLDIQLSIPQWRVAIQTLLNEASAILEKDLLLNISGLNCPALSTFIDDFSNQTPGYSFLQNPHNQLLADQEVLIHRLKSSNKLRKQFWRISNTSPKHSLRIARIDKYFHHIERFLELLAVLIFWTSGLVPRRQELIGITWCNRENARNIYRLEESIVLITSYHKSQWKVGVRPAARLLAVPVAELLVRYLLFVIPMERFWYQCMQSAGRIEDFPMNGSFRGLLLASPTEAWTADHFGIVVTQTSKRLLGSAIGPRKWRHIFIALDRRVFNGSACNMHGVSPTFQYRGNGGDDSDSEADLKGEPYNSQPFDRIRHLQAGHSSKTNNSTYGNAYRFGIGLTDTLLASFVSVSRQWHRFCQVETSAPCSHKRGLSASAEAGPSDSKRQMVVGKSRNLFRRDLWRWPVILDCMQRFLGPDAQPRDSIQQQALILVARIHPETLIILPTGHGKSLLFTLPSQLPYASITILILPLVALRQDLVRRCTQWRIPFFHFDPDLPDIAMTLHAVPNLVMVDVGDIVRQSFQSFALALQQAGRLDRIVVDEAHMILTASNYRPCLRELAHLRQIRVPFLYLTATLPPSAETDFDTALYLTQRRTLRASSNRANLYYCVQSIPGTQQDLIDAGTAYCMQEVQNWGPNSSARGLVFVRTKDMGERLVSRLGYSTLFYSSDTPTIKRAEIWTAWSQKEATCFPFLIGTSALSAGIDYASIRTIIHIDAPTSITNYMQETGRAGRDGQRAKCIIILPLRWRVSWDTNQTSDFLARDCMEMSKYLQTGPSVCLRYQLTAYFDGWLNGRQGIRCNDVAPPQSPFADRVNVLCQHCEQSLTPPLLLSPSSAAIMDRMQSLPHQLNHEPVRPSNPITIIDRMQPPSGPLPAIPPVRQPSSRNISPSSSSSSSSSPGSEVENGSILDTAAALARYTASSNEVAWSRYEDLIAEWRSVCIPCSWLIGEKIDNSLHNDCLLAKYKDSMQTLRMAIHFDKYAACYRCWQPQAICFYRKLSVCIYSDLLLQICWTVLTQDVHEGARIVQLLGGPRFDVGLHAVSNRQLMSWLGKAYRFAGRQASNVARLASVWLEALDEGCMQESDC